MKQGTLIKWKSPANADESHERMIVIEDNGDRLLVEHQVDMQIKPTSVVRLSEVIEDRGY